MQIKILKLLPLLALLLLSCSSNKPSINNSFVLMIKSNAIGFSDTAFIDYNEKKADIQGYFSGKVVLDLKFRGNVCIESICMSRSEFNARYLHFSYYDSLLLDIINRKKLEFSGKTIATKDGFSQEYKDKKVDIKYIVKKDEVFFRDRKNRIIIKIKELP